MAQWVPLVFRVRVRYTFESGSRSHLLCQVRYLYDIPYPFLESLACSFSPSHSLCPGGVPLFFFLRLFVLASFSSSTLSIFPMQAQSLRKYKLAVVGGRGTVSLHLTGDVCAAHPQPFLTSASRRRKVCPHHPVHTRRLFGRIYPHHRGCVSTDPNVSCLSSRWHGADGLAW